MGAVLFALIPGQATPDDFHWRNQADVFRDSVPEVLTWPLVLKSEVAAVLLLWSYYAAFCLLVWGIVRKYADPKTALASVVVFLSSLILAYLSIFLKSCFASLTLS